MSKETSDGLESAGLIRAEDGRVCCHWQPTMPHYHDSEWGLPVTDDRRLFEKVCLEGFHSGMSWRVVYAKRDNFRRAFDDFDFNQVARYDENHVARLMADSGIIRNRAKILSAINNAGRAVELVAEAGSLAAWFWQFEPRPDDRPQRVDFTFWQSQKTSPEAVSMAKALKKRGWSWMGPVNAYSLMQALGLVNDHLSGCWRREVCEAARNSLVRPR